MNKSIKRYIPILSNGIRSIVSPFLSIGFSFVVVNYFSKQLWGEFVDVLLLMLLVTFITNWGNNDFLVRSFSKNPKNIIKNWQDFFLARIPVLILFIVCIILYFPNNIVLWLVLWQIASFIFNSFTAVLNYNRDYGKALIFEVISFFTLISLLIFSKNNMSLTLLIKYYTIQYIVKALLFSVLYIRFFKFNEFKFNTLLLLQSSVFFLLSITGFLQSKIDVYVLKFYTDVITLGEYHIISGFIIFAQSISTILILPYVKNIYRMPEKQLIKIRKFIAKIGFLIQFLVTIIIYYILKEFYNIQLNTLQLIAAFLIGYPTYIYVTYVYNLYKKKLELIVLKTCAFCTILNVSLSIVFLKLNYGITALLFINVAIQIICLIYYTQYKIDNKSFKKI